MAVETRYAVVREGVEVLLTTDKKKADEYDKMLDMADALSLIILDSGCDLSEEVIETLSIHLAEQKQEVLSILSAKKGKPARPKLQPEATEA